MASPEIEKLLESYAWGNEVNASKKMFKLAKSGNSEAKFHLSRIFSENGLRFFASDLWVDLLNHDFEPRESVSRAQYETLTWLGNTTAARKFLHKEKLFYLNDDLDERELVRDIEKLKKELGTHILGLIKTQKNTALSPRERLFKELDLGAGLGYISSQIYFSGTSYELGAALIVSGDQTFEVDFDEYIYPPAEYWPSLLMKSAQLLREVINSGRSGGELVGPETVMNLDQSDREFASRLATFAQDIQERIFFMKGGLSASTNNEKYALSAVAVGLDPSRPVAASFYEPVLTD